MARRNDGISIDSGAAHAAEAEACVRRCTHCLRLKPLSHFTPRPSRGGYPHSWCKLCQRLDRLEWRRTPEYRAWLEQYLARPEVQERRREADRKRQEQRRGKPRACNQTARGRILHCRREARRRLLKAETEPQRVRLTALIAAYDRELERLAAL
jgi:hypothetical protein